jgi:hypothetical protein
MKERQIGARAYDTISVRDHDHVSRPVDELKLAARARKMVS